MTKIEVKYYPPSAEIRLAFPHGFVDVSVATPYSDTTGTAITRFSLPTRPAESYRLALMELEASLSEGIETVRKVLATLPAIEPPPEYHTEADDSESCPF